MRVAIFVVVVAAHVILLLFFPSLRRLMAQDSGADVSTTLIFLPPPSEPAPQAPTWQAPLLYSNAPATSRAPWPRAAGFAQPTPQSGESQQAQGRQGGPQQGEQRQADQQPQTRPLTDWRAQAETTAQIEARAIVDAEDAAEHQGDALTAGFKPLPPPRVKGPELAWGYASHRIHHIPGGPWIYTLSEHCQMLIFIIPLVGCQIGKIEARGDLFKNMHPPVKYGDWDWRVKDP